MTDPRHAIQPLQVSLQLASEKCKLLIQRLGSTGRILRACCFQIERSADSHVRANSSSESWQKWSVPGNERTLRSALRGLGNTP